MDRPYQWNGAWMFTDDNNRGMWDPRRLILLPRVGVAVRLSNRMSLRAGFARFNTPALLQRDADVDSGRAEEISDEEFVRRVEQERRR
jgi:hypothetical protein